MFSISYGWNMIRRFYSKINKKINHLSKKKVTAKKDFWGRTSFNEKIFFMLVFTDILSELVHKWKDLAKIPEFQYHDIFMRCRRTCILNWFIYLYFSTTGRPSKLSSLSLSFDNLTRGCGESSQWHKVTHLVRPRSTASGR